jgi:hypothetical protein
MFSERRLGRPSPALIVSIVALVVALTGTAVAAGVLITRASQLGRNVVTTRAIKDGALTGRKIAQHAITRRNLDLRALGALPLADTATHALNADNAVHASTADSANTATAAENANAVGGQSVEKISWFVPANTPSRTLFDAVGLKITASCDSAGHIIVNASGPATNNAELQGHIDANGTFFSLADSSFTSADSDSLTRDSTTEGSGVLAYATSDGHVATMDYGFDFDTSLPGVGCGFWGQMIYS